eukprot:TRINITY_DN4582_c0_g1_i3.p1 TRINITY_DN4582_c0_g1~~TRINITY_DN4582_c0_g1_i3.p1  ORF type:complete len:180 (+),score=13.44 TRINITY_DN4582_c0_g1_i3:98-637(+)
MGNHRSKLDARQEVNTSRHALCILKSKGTSTAHGLVSFSQENISAPCKLAVTVRNLRSNSFHALHIHEHGPSSPESTDLGPIFNPTNAEHGPTWSKNRRWGVVGNLKTDERGNAYLATTDDKLSLFGENDLYGRSCAVKERQDDFGKGRSEKSKIDGDSGDILCSGQIVLSKSFKHLEP